MHQEAKERLCGWICEGDMFFSIPEDAPPYVVPGGQNISLLCLMEYPLYDNPVLNPRGYRDEFCGMPELPYCKRCGVYAGCLQCTHINTVVENPWWTTVVDIAVGNQGAMDCAIEVLHTHSIDALKEAAILEAGMDIIEVRAKEIMRHESRPRVLEAVRIVPHWLVAAAKALPGGER